MLTYYLCTLVSPTTEFLQLTVYPHQNSRLNSPTSCFRTRSGLGWNVSLFFPCCMAIMEIVLRLLFPLAFYEPVKCFRRADWCSECRIVSLVWHAIRWSNNLFVFHVNPWNSHARNNMENQSWHCGSFLANSVSTLHHLQQVTCQLFFPES